MRLTGIEIRTTSEHVRLVGRVVREANHRVVPWAINESLFSERHGVGDVADAYFEFPRRYESYVAETADAFAIAMMLPSMAAGESLEVDSPVSESLLFNLTSIQEIFHAWFPQFQRVHIHAESRPDTGQSRAHGAATFFSGGVDSFYTLLKRIGPEPLPEPLTHMIFMHGVEQKLYSSEKTDLSQQRAENIAEMTGVECIVGTTNLRSLFPLHWERYYVGGALAAIAHTLSRGLGYVCIPSSHSHREQIMSGTSPLVDERYSTEAMRIVHDGSEFGRADKTARIVEWNQPLVLQNLRVCIENSAGDFNCGKCYKCVRTAVALKAIGVWQQALSFPDKSTAHWDDVISDDHLFHTKDNLQFARAHSIDADLVKQLEQIVRKLNRYDALAAFAKNSSLAHLLPLYRTVRAWAGGGLRKH